MDSFTGQPGPSASREPQLGPSRESRTPSPPRRRSLGDFEDEPLDQRRNITATEMLGIWSLFTLWRECGTVDQCVAFAEQHELIPSEKMCRTHRTPMKITKNTNQSVGSFVCSKRTCKGSRRESRVIGTFFEDIKIDMRHVFYSIYAFAHTFSFSPKSKTH